MPRKLELAKEVQEPTRGTHRERLLQNEARFGH